MNIPFLKCYSCDKNKSCVTLELNPWNDCEKIPLCDECFENWSDNARESQYDTEDENN